MWIGRLGTYLLTNAFFHKMNIRERYYVKHWLIANKTEVGKYRKLHLNR